MRMGLADRDFSRLNSDYAPIAVIGIGCRFPGGIESPQTFWDALQEGRDGTSEAPPSRWNLDGFFDPDPEAVGRTYVRRGGFLGDVSGFDPQFFGISPREAAYMDPQQRLLLEVTWEAFEDAAIPPGAFSHHKVGVFVGLFTHDYENMHMRLSETALAGPHSATGMSATIAANRLSHAFDFTGPSMVIDTACSSSLVAVHLACRALHHGEAEIAVAGGVNLQLMPELTVALCKASMLAPDGRCKSFDASANGYARADGAGMVLLKPLAAAMADGDDIYAIIHGSAVNQDGRSKGITVPSGESQMRVMRDALDVSGISASDITYVEAHGTGTPVGDPIEANALGTVLNDGPGERDACVIGSVKSNFGHTESAAGVAGLIKLALMQRHGRIPPNLHFENPNPHIPFENLNLRVPTEPEDWRKSESGERLAAINSFGFGGTNAHAIVGAAPVRDSTAISNQARDGKAHMFCLSARSDAALRESAQRHVEFLRSGTGQANSLGDLAASVAFGREHHPVRLAATGRSHEDVVRLLEAHCRDLAPSGLVSGVAKVDPSPGLAFVFSGMGQQWWAMGRGLLEEEPVFAQKVAELDAIFGDLSDGLSVREILTSTEEESEINRTEFAQPAIFSTQVGLAALLDSMGVRPDVVIGHSVGEVAAAHAAGALTLEDAAAVCLHRSRLQATLAGRGGMLAVGLPAAEATHHIEDLGEAVCIAAINSPDSVTLAGDTTVLGELGKALEGQGVFARLLNVEVPYHSPVMDEIGQEFEQAIAHIKPGAAEVTFISTVTGGVLDGDRLDARYWNRNVREPVSFAPAMQSLLDLDGDRLIVELGAHPVLATSITECLGAANQKGAPIATLRRKQDDVTTLMSAVGQLYCRGYPLPFEATMEKPMAKISLPNYPWQRDTYWSESEESKIHRIGDLQEEPHPLLGNRQSTPNPSWQSFVRHNRPSYLIDHKVQGAVVFPAAGFAEVGLAAALETLGAGGGVAIEGLKIESPLILAGEARSSLRLSVHGEQQFEIHARSESTSIGPWHKHASGRLAKAQPFHDDVSLDVIKHRLPTTRSKAEIYKRLDGLGLEYGQTFQSLDTVWVGADEALGRLHLAPDVESGLDRYVLHPAILDASLQLLASLPGEGTFLPVSVKRLDVYQTGHPVAWTYGRISSESELRIIADITLLDEEGLVVAKVSGLTCQLFESDRRNHELMSGAYIYDRLWVAKPLDPDAPENRTAGYMPSPTEIVPGLQDLHRQRISENGHIRYWTQAVPALDDLAIGYFFDALRERGWKWRKGESFTAELLSEKLQVSPRHSQFMQCMLEHVEHAGYLESDGEVWRLRKNPPKASQQEDWTSFTLAHPDCHAEATLVQKFGSRLARFLGDEEEPLAALFQVGSTIAEHFYTDSPICRPYNQIVADAIPAIASRLPDGESLRILEVGAGTGGLTSYLLPVLPPARTEYVFTDVSDNFLKQARDKFRAFPFVRYEIFDAEMDGESQGFDLNSFDLIVMSDAAHATVDLRSTLGNLRDLLAPEGVLALTEVTTRRPWGDLVLGLLPGWWAFGDSDLRPDHATLSSPAWLSVMQSCGFSDCAAVTDGLDDDVSLQSVIMGKKPAASAPSEMPLVAEPTETGEAARVVVLSDETGVAEPLAESLRLHNYSVTVVHAAKKNGHDKSLETLLDLDADGEVPPVVVDLRGLTETTPDALQSLADIETVACQRLQEVAQLIADRAWKNKPDLWVVTNGAETVGGSDAIMSDRSSIRGFARVLMNEKPDLNVRLIDLSPVSSEAEIAELAGEILARQQDDEIALRGNRRFVSRVAVSQNLRRADGRDTGYSLERVSAVPPLELVFRESEQVPPGPGEVQVRVCAAGLNFKDFATYSGLVDIGSTLLGLEGAGVVTAVGDDVNEFKVGDAVMGPMGGSLSSPINTKATLLVEKPENLSFEEAAGIPAVFLSAYHALKTQAHLAAGETVMIHTAASGLGLAAIQVARALGATVLATAGNDEKRDFLRGLGIDYVGDSRSGKFANEVLQHTEGRGVDVVLSTLPAARIADNIDILKPATGRLIDLSNIHYDTKLDYGALKKGISVSAFDLHVLADSNPDHVNSLMHELKALFEHGDLRPIPYRVTQLSRIADTIEGFKKASHIGKIIVSLAESIVDMQPRGDDIALREDGSYLITGGLTGFGLSTAKWLASKGAKSLVLVGRRGGDTPGASEELAALRAIGVEVEAIACDISDRRQVKDLIAEFGKSFLPLRGVVHAAMVLRDGAVEDLTTESIREVLAPKIDGAWNLHRETSELPLDFFLLYSSASNLIGNWNQANYAAANEYLESLARFRQAKGLPALAIGWGAIGETGLVARDKDLQTVLGRQGILDLDADRTWAAISYGLRGAPPNITAMLFDWTKARSFFPGVAESPRFSLVMAEHGAAHGGTIQAGESVLAGDLPPAERREIVHRIVVEQVSSVLGLDPSNLDLDQPLEDLGFDSLMAVELQTALEKTTGHSLQRMALSRPDLATTHLIDDIAGVAPEADTRSEDEAPEPKTSDISVEELSDSEVDELLKELAAGE